MDNIVYVVKSLFYFFCFFMIMLIFLSSVFHLLLANFNPTKTKLKIYGIFLEMSKIQVLQASLLIVRYIFLLWCLFSNGVESYALVLLIVPGFIFNVLSKKVFNTIFDLISNIIIYFSLISKNIILTYLTDISFVWYVALIYFLLQIFMFLFYNYSFLKGFDIILKKKQLNI